MVVLGLAKIQSDNGVKLSHAIKVTKTKLVSQEVVKY